MVTLVWGQKWRNKRNEEITINYLVAQMNQDRPLLYHLQEPFKITRLSALVVLDRTILYFNSSGPPTFCRMTVNFDQWPSTLAQRTVHYRPGPSTLAQKTVDYRPGPSTLTRMTVQFGSRPPTFRWTVHFHPFGPSTLDMTCHTLAVDLSQLYSFKFFSSFFSFFPIYFNQKCKKNVQRGDLDV